MACLSREERRRHVAGVFTRIIPHYDLLNTLISLGQLGRWRGEAARAAAGGPNGCMLDVASGTGDLTLAMSRHSRRIVALDLLPGMVRRARRKARRRRAHDVQFVVGDGLSLPFRCGSFTVVSTAFGLRNMPDIPAALAEMARVLCPGGRLVVLELVPPSHGPTTFVKRALSLYLRRVVPFLGGLLVRQREAYQHLFRSAERFPPPEELASLMAELGLVEVSYRFLGLGAVGLHQGTKPP